VGGVNKEGNWRRKKRRNRKKVIGGVTKGIEGEEKKRNLVVAFGRCHFV
jgi:hypothetical protein